LVRSLAGFTWVAAEAIRAHAAGWPGLGLQRLVCPGVEDQRLQLGTVRERDYFTEDDQVIAGAMRLPHAALERRRRVDQDRAAGYAWFEGHSVEHG